MGMIARSQHREKGLTRDTFFSSPMLSPPIFLGCTAVMGLRPANNSAKIKPQSCDTSFPTCAFSEPNRSVVCRACSLTSVSFSNTSPNYVTFCRGSLFPHICAPMSLCILPRNVGGHRPLNRVVPWVINFLISIYCVCSKQRPLNTCRQLVRYLQLQQ